MKRLFCLVLIAFFLLPALGAEESLPTISFGTNFSVDYAFLSPELNVWNLRYGLGIDLLVNLGSSVFIGIDAGAFFGFHKLSVMDTSFDRITVAFPFHVTFSLIASGFLAQAYGGVVALADPCCPGGVFLMSDFVFRFLPDAGIKIGFGDMTCIYLKAGYIFDEPGFFYAGLGARLGLF